MPANRAARRELNAADLRHEPAIRLFRRQGLIEPSHEVVARRCACPGGLLGRGRLRGRRCRCRGSFLLRRLCVRRGLAVDRLAPSVFAREHGFARERGRVLTLRALLRRRGGLGG
jgi:hypothetical protein